MGEVLVADVLGQTVQCATFRIDDQLMGVDIQQVQEINRVVDTTPVPQAPEFVHGVINLRGDVVTVVDLRAVLGLERIQPGPYTRNVIVDCAGEKTGFLVDRVTDVVAVAPDSVELPPANVGGVDGRFFRFVCKLESELLLVLNVEQITATDIGVGQG